jgi:hypothetical protein
MENMENKETAVAAAVDMPAIEISPAPTVVYGVSYCPVGFMICNGGSSDVHIHCAKCKQFMADAAGKVQADRVEQVNSDGDPMNYCGDCFTTEEIIKMLEQDEEDDDRDGTVDLAAETVTLF